MGGHTIGFRISSPASSSHCSCRELATGLNRHLLRTFSHKTLLAMPFLALSHAAKAAAANPGA